MATNAATALLTLDEYRKRYANVNGWEYWNGRAVRKAMPTWLHAILQTVLATLFSEAGYVSGAELDLRIDPDFEPRPDVAAAYLPNLSERYPTKPVDIVAEVLSPDDRMTEVYWKCRQYQRIGIAQIFVFDPEERIAWQWNRETENLDRIHRGASLTNGKPLVLASLWAELDRRAHIERKGGN